MTKFAIALLTLACVTPAFARTVTCNNIYDTKLVLNMQANGASQFTLTLPEGALNGTLQNAQPTGPYTLSGSISCTTNPNDSLLINCFEETGTIAFTAQGTPTVQIAAVLGLNLEEVTTAMATGSTTSRSLAIDLEVLNSDLNVAPGFTPIDFGPLTDDNNEASCQIQ